MAIELSGVQFWSEIILVISNQTRATRSFNFEITRMISDQIALLSVQLPLFTGYNIRDLLTYIHAYIHFILFQIKIMIRFNGDHCVNIDMYFGNKYWTTKRTQG